MNAQVARPAVWTDAPPELAWGRDAEDTYELNEVIIVRHELVMTGGGLGSGAVVANSRRWEVVAGKFKRDLSFDDFYRLMGREDLAKAYHRRYRILAGLAVGAIGTLVAGGALMYLGSRDCKCFSTETKIGVGVFAAGIIGATIVGRQQVQPITEREAVGLADGYNQRLRTRLLLPAEPPLPHVERRGPLLVPYLASQGGGLGLAGHF